MREGILVVGGSINVLTPNLFMLYHQQYLHVYNTTVLLSCPTKHLFLSGRKKRTHLKYFHEENLEKYPNFEPMETLVKAPTKTAKFLRSYFLIFHFRLIFLIQSYVS